MISPWLGARRVHASAMGYGRRYLGRVAIMANDEGVNVRAMADLRAAWCLHVAATLGVADHIAAGVAGIDELAAATESDVDSLHRVLRHLVRKGVFQEPTSGQFALNDAAKQLMDPSLRVFLDLDGIGGRIAHSWGTLLSAVRTGKPAYHEVFGRPFWEDLDANPGIGASFDALMDGHGVPDPAILLSGDWDSIRTVVDVGGGTGRMLAEILREHPEVQGTLVDFPRAAAESAERFSAAGVAERATIVGQSFFDPLPAGADLYLLAAILNDWPDDQATLILAGCAEAAGPSGRVVVLGGVSADEQTVDDLEPEFVLMGGKNRSLTEFKQLALEAGLAVHTAGHLPSGHYAVECRPAKAAPGHA
jgi:2,7-dihydroxy-5-methyl-1-naphthoate 7-O-methyltransferase